MTRKRKEQPTIIFSKHAVAWIDLLSQKEAMKKLVEMPETPEEKKAFIESLRATFGQVRHLRGQFRTYYEGMRNAQLLPNRLPEHVRARITELREERIGLHGISDAMALYVPIYDDTAGDRTKIVGDVWDVYSMLYSCATIMLSALTGKQVIRGGIDIGIGGEVEPGEIYGPALSRAYLLESEQADYPRVLVGEEFVEYLILTSMIEGTDVEARLARDFAAKCLGMITVDDDGKRTLHYLSNGQCELMTAVFGREVVRVELAKAHEFISRELERFRRQGNSKLAARYRRLKGYFDFYMPGW